MSYAARVIIAVSLFVVASRSTFAIREFDIHTIESLGRKLYEKAQQSSSSQSELEQRAILSAKDALKGIDLRGYRFVVLPDPKGSGFLVYALATSRDPEEIVVGIHYRVTVSADASHAERVDALSRTRVVATKKNLPQGYQHLAGFVLGQIVSDKPVETLVYVTLLHKASCMVITPDESMWWIQNGKISKDKRKALEIKPSSQ
jgi:hypothetical protein